MKKRFLSKFHKNKQLFLISALLTIFLMALGLRLWQLESLPNGLNRDEASLAYNALLLAQAGKDEWGESWPITLRSFGDYKLAGATWHILISGVLLGFNDFSARLPSALAGSLLVLVGAWLGWKLHFSRKAILLIALLLSFSPIMIFFSRFGFEAIIALFWFFLALSCWTNNQVGKKRFFFDFLGVVSFILASLTYNTPLLYTPLLICWLLILRWPMAKKSTSALIISLLTTAGLIWWLLLPATQAKQGISIFTDATLLANYPIYREQFDGLAQTIIGNQYFYWLIEISARFFNFFSPNFLLLKGGTHPWHQLPGFAHLTPFVYFLSLVSILTSTLFLIFAFLKKITLTYLKKQQVLLSQSKLLNHFSVKTPLLLLISIIYVLAVASITVDAPHATRSLSAFVFLFLLIAWFYDFFFYSIGNYRKTQFFASLGVLILIPLCSLNYLYHYFTFYPQQSAIILQSGLVAGVNATDHSGEIFVLDPGGYEYIRTAWYEKMSAEDFFASIKFGEKNSIGFSPGLAVGQYRFLSTKEQLNQGRLIEWKDERWQIN